MPHTKHDARFNNEIKVMDINLALFLRTHSKNQRIAHKAHRKFLVRGDLIIHGEHYFFGLWRQGLIEEGLLIGVGSHPIPPTSKLGSPAQNYEE